MIKYKKVEESIMWLFECSKTYAEMRQKIAHAVFYISLIEVFVLAQISSEFSEVLKTLSFNTETEIFDIKLYVAYIYLPLVFSVLENMFRAHDKIQKIFGIRKRFDKKVIFVEYINQLGINFDKNNLKKLYAIYDKEEDLESAINRHFYYYVSGTNPKIDEHYVHMALTSWCWVWIVLDSIVITLFLTLLSFLWKVGFNFVFGMSIFMIIQVIILITLLKTECKNHTRNEIERAVKKDKSDKGAYNNELKDVILNALSNK